MKRLRIIDTALRDAPSSSVLVTAAVLGALGSVVCLVLAVRALRRARAQQRSALAGQWSNAMARSRALEVAALIPPLLVVATVVALVEHFRKTLMAGVSAPAMDRQATLLARGLFGEIAAVPLGILAVLLPALLSCGAIAVAARGRLIVAGLRAGADCGDETLARTWAAHAAPSLPVLLALALAFPVLGLGPMIGAALSSSLFRLESYLAVATVEPRLQAAALREALHASRVPLDLGLKWTAIGTMLALALSGALVWMSHARRTRAGLFGPDPNHSPARQLAGPAVLLGLAAVCWGLTLPIRRENAQPWPAGSALRRFGETTSILDGPDTIEPGPLVTLTPTGLSMDGTPMDRRELTERLRVRANNARLLHPDRAGAGAVLVLCATGAGRTPTLEVLLAAAEAGFGRATFILEKQIEAIRPTLGRVLLWTSSGATVTLAQDDRTNPASSALLRPEQLDDCEALEAAIVAVRRRGQTVAVLLPASAAKP